MNAPWVLRMNTFIALGTHLGFYILLPKPVINSFDWKSGKLVAERQSGKNCIGLERHCFELKEKGGISGSI